MIWIIALYYINFTWKCCNLSIKSAIERSKSSFLFTIQDQFSDIFIVIVFLEKTLSNKESSNYDHILAWLTSHDQILLRIRALHSKFKWNRLFDLLIIKLESMIMSGIFFFPDFDLNQGQPRSFIIILNKLLGVNRVSSIVDGRTCKYSFWPVLLPLKLST
jgi:hypothetical protein